MLATKSFVLISLQIFRSFHTKIVSASVTVNRRPVVNKYGCTSKTTGKKKRKREKKGKKMQGEPWGKKSSKFFLPSTSSAEQFSHRLLPTKKNEEQLTWLKVKKYHAPRKLARLITQCGNIFYTRHGFPSSGCYTE